MFKASEAAQILGVSKTTLIRYEKDMGFRPLREYHASMGMRQYSPEDIYKIHAYLEESPNLLAGCDKETLDMRIALMAISISTVGPKKRREQLTDIIASIAEEYPLLGVIELAFKDAGLLG